MNNSKCTACEGRDKTFTQTGKIICKNCGQIETEEIRTRIWGKREREVLYATERS